MADVTGTNGNDILFFQGTMTQLTMSLTNPYSGETFFIDDVYNSNTLTYDGGNGSDTLFMTNQGDALFVRHAVTDVQAVMNIESFFAGDGGDVIFLADATYTLGNVLIDGGGASDLLVSNIGNDTLNGRDGNDILDGGPGNDILNGGSNNLSQPSGNDRLNGGSGADILRGEDGNDTLIFYADTVLSGAFGAMNVGSPGVAGTETMISAAGKNGTYDIFNGGTGYDTLIMTDGSDALWLDDPYNQFHSSGTSLRLISVEQIDAGGGEDIVDLTHWTLSYGDVTINGGDGNDYLWSSSGNDLLNGDTGDDELNGGFGDDELNGGTGNDTLYGGLGNDLLRGGDGNDTLYGGASSSSSYVVITEQAHYFGSDVVFPNLVERVNILDLVPPGDNALGIAAGDLSVDYSTTASVTFLSTGAGYDNSLGFYNIGQDGTIYSVVLAFPNVKDVAPGQSATIDLPGAPDTDFGFFIIANGANKNNDFSGYDLVNGEFKFIYNYGKSGERLATINDMEKDIKLVYYDGSMEKVVVGSNNHIYHTTERGGATNLNSDNETHVVSGVMEGSDGSTLRIGFEDLPNLGDADYNDVVFDLTIATKATYTLLESDGDTLLGGAGNDYLNGGIGDDLLVGGEGADLLFGDQGADVFLFQSIADASDTIEDFETGIGGDMINLTDVLEGFDAQNSDVNDFMRLVNSGGDTVLEVNTDGQGSDFAALVTLQGGVGGASLSDLLAAGNLMVDQHITV